MGWALTRAAAAGAYRLMAGPAVTWAGLLEGGCEGRQARGKGHACFHGAAMRGRRAVKAAGMQLDI